MDCRSAQLLLDLAGPSAKELDAPEAVELENHLADCHACESLAQAAQRFDAAVVRAMAAVEVPDGLRDRLVGKLNAERRGPFRRTAIRVAVAAAVLIGVGFGGLVWYQNWKVSLNLPQLSTKADEPFLTPTKENTDAWLKRVGGNNLAATRDFDYSKVIQREVVFLDGRPVPQLRFHGKTPRAFANVYVLDGATYDLSSIKKQIETLNNSGAFREVKIAKFEDQLFPNILYLIFYRGMDLKGIFDKKKFKDL